MQKLKVGVLGTGNVGHALGNGFIAQGCEVKMASRDANNPKAKDWAQKHGALASPGTFADAAKFGEVIVIATAFGGTETPSSSPGPTTSRARW